MRTANTTLPKVSVLFVTYNRPHTLVATYETFVHIIDYPRERLEFIVADDGSDSDVIAVLDKIPFDVRCYSKTNQGLGANSNKAIQAATGDYILFLQDDWITTRRPAVLKEAVAVMERFSDLGLVNLYHWDEARIADDRDAEGIKVHILASTDESGQRVRTYTDRPHLKRRNFHEVVGWYREGVPMTVMEDAMDESVSIQTTYKIAKLGGDLPFVHIGDRYSFNPGRKLVAFERLLQRLPGGGQALTSLRWGRRLWRQWTGRQGM